MSNFQIVHMKRKSSVKKPVGVYHLNKNYTLLDEIKSYCFNNLHLTFLIF